MRINHNIAALNTYRQLGQANNASANSMEKLSSGLRINKAGDDAAGLAISEKMRGQVRGLEQAQRNSQDGISMIQTAEGALNETHSILQRMRELATQSANDTNTADDRGEIQKEMNQLTSEINRIGNTTEFNTKNILDGGQQVNANATVSAKSLTGGLDTGDVDGVRTETSLGVDAESETWSATIANNTLASGNVQEFTFNGATVTLTANDSDTNNFSASSDTAATISIDKDQTAAQITTALKDAFTAMKNYDDGDTSNNALADFTFNDNSSDLEITDVSTNGDTNAALNLTTAGTHAGAINIDGGIAAVSSEGTGVNGVTASGNVQFSDGDGVPAEGTTITLANKTVAFFDSSSGNFDTADHAQSSLSADYVVDTYGITNGDGIAQAVENAVNTSPIAGYKVSVDGTNTDQVNVQATSIGDSGLNAGELANSSNASLTAATGSLTFSDQPTEGSQVTVGSSKVGFYDSTSGNYADASAAKTDLGTDFVIDINGKSTANQIKDSVLALDPQMSDVTLADGGVGKIDITASSQGAAGNQIELDAPEAGAAGFEANFQIGANNAQSLTVEIGDMRADALNLTGSSAGEEVIAEDKAKAYYTETKNVTDGTNNETKEFALDVSTHEKATAAISVLDDAIASVSSERSKLGSYQNRLEHTINNLGTSSENLTAAESRIRDVDYAFAA